MTDTTSEQIIGFGSLCPNRHTLHREQLLPPPSPPPLWRPGDGPPPPPPITPSDGPAERVTIKCDGDEIASLDLWRSPVDQSDRIRAFAAQTMLNHERAYITGS